jgi:hypothetical protein
MDFQQALAYLESERGNIEAAAGCASHSRHIQAGRAKGALALSAFYKAMDTVKIGASATRRCEAEHKIIAWSEQWKACQK